MKGSRYILFLTSLLLIKLNVFSIEKKEPAFLNTLQNGFQYTYTVLNGIDNTLNGVSHKKEVYAENLYIKQLLDVRYLHILIKFHEDFNYIKIKGLTINSKIVKKPNEFKTKNRFKKVSTASIFLLVVFSFLGYIYFVSKRRKKNSKKHRYSEIELNDEKTNLIKEKVEKEIQEKAVVGANLSDEAQMYVDGVIGFSEHILETSNLDEQIKRGYLSVINKSGHFLVDIIENIIALSKIETKHLKLIYTECKLNETLDELHYLFGIECDRTGKKNIEITVDKEFDDSDFVIYSDGKRIRQVLYYLLNNALKFTNEGSIRFGYYIEIPNIVFYVKDNITDLSNAEKEMVFECFGQFDEKTNGGPGNSCLDLIISKGIVENLEGKIWVESNIRDKQTGENNGSVFYFTIPYQGVSRNLSKSYQKTDYKEYVWPNKTILIVEDAIISYELLTKFLKDSQVNFLHATDGKQAVDLCKNNDRIDLVLMDIQLPIMDGLEATGLIKNNNPELPIIAQTANAMEEDKPNIIAAGCDDYISKPINRLELLQKINVFLAQN